MKKSFKVFALSLVAVSALFACSKEMDVINDKPVVDGNKTILTIKATNPESVATKTTMSGTTPSWLAGDKITVIYKNTSDAVATAESTPLAGAITTATFDATLVDANTSIKGYAVYPANDLAQTLSVAKIPIAAEQHPTGTAFDGASDIMVSEAFTPSGTVSTRFARLGAILRVKVSNATLNDEKILNLSVTAESNLVGDASVSLSDATLTGLTGGSVTVTAKYEPANQFTVGAANEPNDEDKRFVYLIVYPQALAAGSTLTISGETENYSFSKAITLPNKIVLNPGHIVPLNVTVDDPVLKDKVFFEERFLDANGTGGNDGSWSGNVASSTFSATGWTATKSYYGKQCARFGNGSNNGNATTPSISIPTIYKDQTLKLYIKAGAWSGKGTTLGLSVDGATPSSTSLTLKDGAWDTYDLTLSSITKSTITVSFTKSDQWFLDAIIVYYGDKPAINPGLAYAEASINKTYGDASFTNTLTNPYSLTVSYTSSEPTVASVNASSGAVTILKAGTTRITASSAAQGDYSAGEAYYDLTVGKAETGLAYAIDDVAKNVGDDNFTNPLTNPHTLAVCYSSTDEDVATVNSDGEVTIKAGGSTIISATFATNDYYLDGEAYYLLTVKKAIKTMAFANASVDVDEGDLDTIDSINALTIEDTDDNDISAEVASHLSFSSSNTSVVDIDDDTFAAYAPGHAVITAKIENDPAYENKQTTFDIYVLGDLAAPTGVTLTTLNKASLVASWTAAVGAESYSWELINTSTSAVAKSGTTTETSVDIDYSADNVPAGTYKLSVISTLSSSHAGINNSAAGESGTKTVTSSVNVTFEAGTDKSNTTSLSKGGVEISISSGTFSRDDNYRVYASATMTITAPSGTVLKKIIFDGTGAASGKKPDNLSTLTGSYSWSSPNGTWTGSSSSVTFSASAQAQIANIIVTFE